MIPQVGDRIELVAMVDDPAPIEPGTRGTVVRVTPLWDGKAQVSVAWDVHRSLALVIPPDEVRIVEP